MKVGIASLDWSNTVTNNKGKVPGGANYIRLQQWQRLSKNDFVSGLLVAHPKHGFGVLDYRGKQHYDIDIIIMQRIMHGQLTQDLMSANNRQKPVISDLDDWYWGLHQDNQAWKNLQAASGSDENLDNYKANICLSDVVVTSTPFLYNKLTDDFGIKKDKVRIIENRVNTEAYKRKPLSTKKPVVGWVGSVNHRSADLEVVSEVFKDGYYRMHHSGATGYPPTMADKIGIDSGRVSQSPMYDPYLYGQKAFTSFDIGIAPLNDIPFNHAKSWIKAIEYAAAGIPFICSDVSEYRRLHETYGIGRLASTTEEWKKHLSELSNQQVRSDEAKNIRAVACERLDIRDMAAEWDSLLDDLI
jgi:glycosyltransferase involved in cell wall biosynthesis